MAEIEIPGIGQRVRIHTKPAFYWLKHYNPPIEGVVAPRESYDDPETIRLCPASTYMNVSVISIYNITRIEYLDRLSDSLEHQLALQDTLQGQIEVDWTAFDKDPTPRAIVQRDDQPVIASEPVINKNAIPVSLAEPADYLEPKKPKLHYVKGSKGDIYTVTQAGRNFRCNCIAGQMNRLCKHVKQVRADLGLPN